MGNLAPAILGSTLLEAARESQGRHVKRVSTACTSIDSALEGGFEYGKISSMAGAGGTGKKLITLQAIARHLLEHEKEQVALIDTRGTFSPVRLRDVLVHQLKRLQDGRERRDAECEAEQGRVEQNLASENDHGRQAIQMLDRVQVTRVLDFTGMVEEVGEIIERLEKLDMMRIPQEILDSEDDEEDDRLLYMKRHSSKDSGASANDRISMVVIDNIASVTSSIIETNQTQGLALLTTFIRSLKHMTINHNICSIIVNQAVALSSSSSSRYQRRPTEDVSIFASVPGKPALGKTYAQLVDLSIFLSSLPRSKADADIAFGEENDHEVHARWRTAGILEVLKDRSSSREGKWAAFEMRRGVEMIPYD